MLADLPLLVSSLVILTIPQIIECGHERQVLLPQKKICGENEQYYKCRPCNQICDDSVAGACTDKCLSGCDCLKGYKRNANGVCIPEAYCKLNKTCNGLNEIYGCRPCNPGCKKSNKICTKICILDCQCVKGYVRNSKNICVPEQNCGENELCRELNEHYVNCLPQNEPSCFTLPSGPETCSKCKPGCTCKPGFVRHEGKCIRSDSCPVVCKGMHEIAVPCKHCNQACFLKKPAFCPAICIPGCDCEEGYCRNSKKQCVPPIKCPKSEEYVQCKPCKDDESCYESKEPCLKICKPGCACIKGHKRNKEGVCVPKEKCLKPLCKKNEEFSCLACDEGCVSHGKACTAVCTPGCRCKPNFKRNKHGLCIPEKLCPKK